MRLKELRIKGFKSFANDTRIAFDEQVIGIVGPNGSGKSNIVDAVKWVLGEQKTRNLRLDTMTDVIFNGTKAKKKSAVAEVSLVFDNTRNLLPTDYKQVEIGRVVYRSGDSEYRLNGVTCRRKDIQNLFIDTGIGSNSYAIIQLGMVEDILLDKDNSRRKMFEQAAGISKFKIRKRETLLKLNSTQADLERVKDILHELDQNMKRLEKQAKRTKRFYEIKEQYKSLSISLYASTYKEKDQKIHDLKKKINEEEDNYRDLKNNVLKLESELEKSKVDSLNKEQDLSKNQKEFNELVDKIRVIENQKQINQQELGFSQQSIVKLENALAEISGEITQLQSQIDPINHRCTEEQTALLSLQSAYALAKEEYDKIKSILTTLDGGADGKSAMLQEYEEKLFGLEKREILAKNDLERNIKQITYIDAQNAEINQNKETLTTQFQKLDAEINGATEKRDGLINTAKEAQEKLDAIGVKIEEKNRDLLEIQKQKEVKQNEYNLLKGMIDNLEGFPESSKFIVEKWKDKAVLFSDIFDCQDAYKGGLEVFLEPYLNYFICEDYKQAMSAVSLLNASQKGKSNFFILDQIESDTPQISCSIPGAIKAQDVLEIEDKYKPLVNYLLNDVYFVDNWDDNMFNQINGVTIIDKEGRFTLDKRSLKGGSVGLFEGKKIGQKKGLEKIEKKIGKLEKEINELKKEIEELEQKKSEIALVDSKNEIQQLNNKIELYTKEKIQSETNLEVYERNLLQLQENKSTAENEISELNTTMETLANEKVEAKQLLETLKAEIEQSSGELEKIRIQAEGLSQKHNESNIALLRQQNLLEQLNQDLEFKTQRIQRLEIDKDANVKELQELKQKLIACDEKSTVFEEQLKVVYAQKQGMESSLNLSEQDYFNEKSGINEKENHVQKLRRTLNEKQVKVNEQKSDLQSLHFDLQGIKERLSIEFQLEKSEIQQIITTVEEQEINPEVEEKVSRLRKRIENYGEINPLAVQAYEEVQERYENIAGQRDDILEAEKSLLETITEIQDSASAQFMEAFNQVNIHFKDVFRSLFSEDDTCDLVLKDTENPLDSEIEIVARPKGKRPKTLKQLSGGESTLTATALLFALYLLKPAPFCIFDEVDAPLDDHNIEKFTKLIREFSERSQFIIITHNKSTMASVDTIYGVFMQEKGVSGITQVDFRDYEHETVFRSANN